MNKLNPKIVSLSLAITAGTVFLICAILFTISSEATLWFFRSMFHGIDITQIAKNSVSLGETISGLIKIFIGSWIIGWLFVSIYNKFIK